VPAEDGVGQARFAAGLAEDLDQVVRVAVGLDGLALDSQGTLGDLNADRLGVEALRLLHRSGGGGQHNQEGDQNGDAHGDILREGVKASQGSIAGILCGPSPGLKLSCSGWAHGVFTSPSAFLLAALLSPRLPRTVIRTAFPSRQASWGPFGGAPVADIS